MVERGRPRMTTWCTRFACWVSKATDTHSEYVVLIAFPLQQWLYGRASLLCHTCTACLTEKYIDFSQTQLFIVANYARSDMFRVQGVIIRLLQEPWHRYISNGSAHLGSKKFSY
jgi:hypothetical protein